MSVTSGFFNSKNKDRLYNAEQMSSIFDGIIRDGVYASVGTAFMVNATDPVSKSITIGEGRCWFDHTWILNDELLTIPMPSADVSYGRIDAIVFDIDHTEVNRSGRIMVLQGTASGNPKKPALINTDKHKQYALCYITRPIAATESDDVIKQSQIEYCVGLTDTPFVTSPLQRVSIEAIVSQWESEWNEWYNSLSSKGVDAVMNWMEAQKLAFEEWFSNISVTLDGDVAASLAKRVTELEDRFTTLAKEYAVYQVIQDSNGDQICDGNGLPIEGRVIYRIVE